MNNIFPYRSDFVFEVMQENLTQGEIPVLVVDSISSNIQIATKTLNTMSGILNEITQTFKNIRIGKV